MIGIPEDYSNIILNYRKSFKYDNGIESLKLLQDMVFKILCKDLRAILVLYIDLEMLSSLRDDNNLTISDGTEPSRYEKN